MKLEQELRLDRSAVKLVEFKPFPRTYVYGWRLHHGLLGCVLAVIGAALAAHDRRDFPWSVRDGLVLGR
jgi:hypothetical protein